jgi:hypothetical protein
MKQSRSGRAAKGMVLLAPLAAIAAALVASAPELKRYLKIRQM